MSAGTRGRMAARSLWLAGLLVAMTATGVHAADPPAGDPVEVDLLAPLPAEAWTRGHAAHLLRRAGFGGTMEEIAALHAMGLDGAVEHLLAAGEESHPPFEANRPEPLSREKVAGLSQEERKKLRQQRQRNDRQQIEGLRAWWLERMIEADHPLVEKMTLFWHGHFCSGYRDVRNSYHLYQQNETFRRYALGSFGRLVHAIAKDPAMLEYLDNNRNRKGQPNENFAREVMELFTLGLGQYTERDIKEAARAFTGWTFRGNEFVKNLGQHDFGVKKFMGQEGEFDGEDVIEILLEKEQCARYMARKLFVFFAHERPSDAVVAGLGDTFRGNGYELKPLLRQLFRSQAFYARESVGDQIKSPVDLVVGICRALPLRSPTRALPTFTAQLGQQLFEPPNVKGWPGGRDWISTSSLLKRYNLVAAVFGPIDNSKRKVLGRALGGLKVGPAPAPKKQAEAPEKQQSPDMQDDSMQDDNMKGDNMEGPQMEGPDAEPEDPAQKRRRAQAEKQRKREERRRRLAERKRRQELRLFQPAPYLRRYDLESTEQIVDHLTELLLANEVSQADREVLVEALERSPEGEPSPFDPEAPDAGKRFEKAIKLIVNMPEFQLN